MATDDDQRETEGAARKRAAPTIDLDPSDVTDTTPKSEVKAEAKTESEAEPQSEAKPQADDAHEAHVRFGGWRSDASSKEAATSAADSSSDGAAPPLWRIVLTAAFSAAVVALLVSGLWNVVSPNNSDPDIPPAQTSTIESLESRVAQLESKPAPVPAPADTSALTRRLDALDQTIANVRNDLAALRGQVQALAAKVAEPAEAGSDAKAAPTPDLSGIEERLAKLEQRADAASAEAAKPVAAPPPPDDTALRRALAATSLDQTVRQGLPYAAILAAAARLGGEASVLAPLEPFAATGVPTAETLCRELLAQLPRLAPAPKSASKGAPKGAPAAGNWVERLGDSASRLVKVTRIDEDGTGRAALLARATTAANRNDLKQASEIVAQLPEQDRSALQGWIGKVQARGAALAASRAFAETATAALPPSPH